MDISGKKILVFGTGISGISAAKLLLGRQARVILFDGNDTLDCARILEEFPEDAAVEIYTGELPQEKREEIGLVVLSPGVPADLPLVCDFRAAGIPVWGEVELAYRCAKGDLLAITGTNGKTTTTSLVGEILKSRFDNVKVVGNIGIPYTSMADDMTEETVTVAEISSFQLETIDSFCPRVSAILNITPDHLNRHHTMENYIAAKLAITKNQTADQICVLNYEDE
ncbi:MAG: UDP-N-acetylmuramoyl-L-alanine--D-glutamate ligase, partial [Clostridiales bacterium]|nr:UDP-N-acetylmuramoyl-L-alanine--D-glutamate ligase [Clostridiales bacterium]